jgi:hypothetical protein
MTLALTRLEWLGGDRFVIGSLVTIVALIGVFIVWPSIAIFIPMFTNDAGEFAPGVYGRAVAGAYCPGDPQLHRPVDCGRHRLHLLRPGAGDLHHPHRQTQRLLAAFSRFCRSSPRRLSSASALP